MPGKRGLRGKEILRGDEWLPQGRLFFNGTFDLCVEELWVRRRIDVSDRVCHANTGMGRINTDRAICMVQEVLQRITWLRESLSEDLCQRRYTGMIMSRVSLDLPERRIQGVGKVRVRFREIEWVCQMRIYRVRRSAKCIE